MVDSAHAAVLAADRPAGTARAALPDSGRGPPRPTRGHAMQDAMSMRALLPLVLLLAPSLAAQDFCLPDANDDGHPRFGHTAIRVLPESMPGWTIHHGNAGCTTFALADFDGDGHLDAAVGDVYATHAVLGKRGFVSILWGKGDGVFAPGPIVEVGLGPCHVEAPDLDGDGRPDLAIADEFADAVVVLLNLGGGAFSPPVASPAGDMPRSLACADLDGDGDVDLLVLNTLSSDVSVLRNNGDGTFEAQARHAVPGVTPRGNLNLNFRIPGPFLAAGDFDNDGSVDVAIPCGSKVRFLVNDGVGGFTLSPVTCSMSIPEAYALVAADLDDNGWVDVAATSFHGAGGPECLMVYLSRGPLVFDPEARYDAGWITNQTSIQYATGLAAGDADADGDLDLVVCHEVGGETMVLLRNRGDGTFEPKEHVRSRLGAWFARFADVNGDLRTDLLSAAHPGRSTFHALLGAPDIHATNYRRYPKAKESFPPGQDSLTAGDLDNDGDIDLVATCWAGKNDTLVRVYLNDGTGAFDTIHDYAVGPPKFAGGADAAIGDLDGDGWPDLVVADKITSGGYDEPGRLWTFRNRGDGTFEVAQMIPLEGVFPRRIRLADLDNDGDLDAVAYARALYPGNALTPVPRELLLFENENGDLGLRARIQIGMYPWPGSRGDVAVHDFNHDGQLDLATAVGPTDFTGHLRVFFGGVDGFTYVDGPLTTLLPWPLGLTVADTTGDGIAELVVSLSNWVSPSNPTIQLFQLSGNSLMHLKSRGDQRSRHRTPHVSTNSGSQLHLAIEAEIAASHLVSSGGSSDWAASNFLVESPPGFVALADFNSDGEVDLAVATNSSINIYLARPCPACIPDCDADGDLDVFDYLCFLDRFAARDPRADLEHDGDWDAFDLLAFQGLFARGCE